MKLPRIRDLADLVRHCKGFVEPRATLDLTVGWTPDDGSWSWQTGDNSFTGGAYLHPVWATASLTRRTNSREVARDLRSQLEEHHV